jgi:FkbH-like protein
VAEKPTRCLLISDFNVGNLHGLLANDQAPPAVEPALAPFGQVTELLVDPRHECWRAEPDVVMVWTQPQAVIESFARLLSFDDITPEQMLAEVDRYAALVSSLVGRVRNVFVPTWVIPPHKRGLGMIDLTHSRGIAGSLLAMNARLVQNLRAAGGVFLLDAQRWVGAAGRAAYSPQMWYMAKVPFANAVFAEAVADLKAALAGLSGRSRKLIILDLDDTLWGGIVGDDGWQQLKLGGHDPIGEAFVEFQQALKALENRGIVLGIVSKNEESVALEAIRNHPDMVLRMKDFAGWRINWNDKAQNIVELTGELNLGLQSVVFIDDNAVERDRVRQALPEVLVPEWPGDKMLYAKALSQLRCFDSPDISIEDQVRAQMYVADRQRRDLAQSLASIDDFIRSLEIRISAEPLTRANLSRAAQLFNKTNQMNLATRRLSAEQIWAWAQEPDQRMWTLRVVDKFGDSGLVGLVSFRRQSDQGEITDFILSCRVFGRRVEEAMLHIAIGHARSLGVKLLIARYLATEKNKPTLSFFERSGLHREADGWFVWNTDREYPPPELVTLDLAEFSGSTSRSDAHLQ